MLLFAEIVSGVNVRTPARRERVFARRVIRGRVGVVFRTVILLLLVEVFYRVGYFFTVGYVMYRRRRGSPVLADFVVVNAAAFTVIAVAVKNCGAAEDRTLCAVYGIEVAYCGVCGARVEFKTAESKVNSPCGGVADVADKT